MDTPSDVPEPMPPDTPEPESAPAPAGSFCRHCGYEVSGIPVGQPCPECGAEIVDGAADLLHHASPPYLGTLSRGLTIVLIALFTQVGFKLISFLAGAVPVLLAMNSGGGTSTPRLLQITQGVTSLVEALITFVMLLGWWLFSQPDPGYSGRDDGSKARFMLRITLIAAALIAIGNSVASFFLPMVFNPVQPTSHSSDIMLILAVVGIVMTLLSVGIWVARFLATMMYIQWLAHRARDQRVVDQCRLYIWLLPLIYVLGFLCLGLGPLASLIIFIIFLFKVREMIQAARRHHAPDLPVPAL